MTKKFVLCVDGVYVKNGKILLLKRSVEPFKGCWHLIGGHVEENETLKEALKREFKEETNLTVRVGGIIDGRIEETVDRIKIIVALKIMGSRGKIKPASESEESVGSMRFHAILAIIGLSTWSRKKGTE